MWLNWDYVRDWDHPRVCGEKLVSPFLRILLLGSPPRVRGKVSLTSGKVDAERITPACAGKRALAQVIPCSF